MQKKRPIHQPIEIVIVNKNNNIKNIKKSEGKYNGTTIRKMEGKRVS